MAPAQISLANAYATILAAVFYAAALVVFVIYDNSDAGRVAGSGLQLELTYFVLYFLYFGLYLGFVTALTKLAPVSRRIVLGLVAAIIVAPLGYAAFRLGYALGVLLFFIPGFLLAMPGGLGGALTASLLAIPATGVGVGYAFNRTIIMLAGWEKSNPAVASIARANISIAATCACIA